MGKNRKRRAAAGRSYLPKTPTGWLRHFGRVAHKREHLQREITEANGRDVAVTADNERMRDELECAPGRVLLTVIKEKQALAADGDARAHRSRLKLKACIATMEMEEPRLPESKTGRARTDFRTL